MGGIRLGNLTPEQIESRLGIRFSNEDRNYLIKNHNPNAAKIEQGRWHCFDFPFVFVASDKDACLTYLEIFKKYEAEMKEIIQITFDNFDRDQLADLKQTMDEKYGNGK